MNNMSVKSKRMTKMWMFCLNDGDNEVIQQNHDEPAYHEEQAFHHCPGCKENADAINGLLSKNLLNSTNSSKHVSLLLHMMNSYFA